MIFTTLLWYSWLIFYKKQKDNVTKSISVSNEFEIVKQVSLVSQNKTNGHDARYKEKEEDSSVFLSNFKKNRERYAQLQMLQNPHISVIEKLMLIEAIEQEENDSIYAFHLLNGGFWKDWE